MAGNIMVWKFIKMSRNSAKHLSRTYLGEKVWTHGKQKLQNAQRLIKFRL